MLGFFSWVSFTNISVKLSASSMCVSNDFAYYRGLYPELYQNFYVNCIQRNPYHNNGDVAWRGYSSSLVIHKWHNPEFKNAK